MCRPSEGRHLLQDDDRHAALESEKNLGLRVGMADRRLHGLGGAQSQKEVVSAAVLLKGHAISAAPILATDYVFVRLVGARSTSRQSIDLSIGHPIVPVEKEVTSPRLATEG